MPLSQANAIVSLTWEFDDAIQAPFKDLFQGPDGISFTMQGLDLTVFDQGLFLNLSIHAGQHVDVDFHQFINLVRANTGFEGVLALCLLPQSGDVTLGPSPSNSLEWFFGTVDDTIRVRRGGCFFLSDTVPAAGDFGATQVVSPTERYMRLSNNGTGDLTVLLGAIGQSTRGTA